MVSAISVAQVWRSVMACMGPLGEAPGTSRKIHSRETVTTGLSPALISVMMPPAAGALMMWWRQ